MAETGYFDAYDASGQLMPSMSNFRQHENFGGSKFLCLTRGAGFPVLGVT